MLDRETEGAVRAHGAFFGENDDARRDAGPLSRGAEALTVCFSAQADVMGGLVVGAIGIDALRHVDGRKDHLLVASLPLLLGAHQLIEAFVWWGLQGDVSHEVERAALWGYLLIAFVILPVFVPSAVLALEVTRARRRRLAPFVLLGVAVAAVLLEALLRGPLSAEMRMHHVSYGIPLARGGLIVAFYVVAVCGPLLFSSDRRVRIFGLANLVAVVALALATRDGLPSFWCMYAALTSGVIALRVRMADRAAPRARTGHLTSA